MNKKSSIKTRNQTALERRMPLERLAKIHDAIAAGKYPNCNQLAQEMEVTRRTIKRDLAFMRDRDVPLAYDPQRHGFYFTGPVTTLPILPHLTQDEMFSLSVARQAVGQYQSRALVQPLETAYRKLSWRLADDDRANLQGVENIFSFRPFAPEAIDDGTLHTVQQGTRETRVVRFLYRNAGAPNIELRRVRPYHVTNRNNCWYLIGHDLKRRAIRTFALSRMGAPELEQERFERPADFDPEKHLEGSLTVMRGQGDYDIVIELDQWATDLIRGRIWHPSQELMILSGGSHLHLRLNNLEEITALVLNWAGHATVIRPTQLGERVASAALAIWQAHAGMGAQEQTATE